jgi:hypothetical protein
MCKNCSGLPYSTANPRFFVASFQQQMAMSRCRQAMLQSRQLFLGIARPSGTELQHTSTKLFSKKGRILLANSNR